MDTKSMDARIPQIKWHNTVDFHILQIHGRLNPGDPVLVDSSDAESTNREGQLCLESKSPSLRLDSSAF